MRTGPALAILPPAWWLTAGRPGAHPGPASVACAAGAAIAATAHAATHALPSLLMSSPPLVVSPVGLPDSVKYRAARRSQISRCWSSLTEDGADGTLRGR